MENPDYLTIDRKAVGELLEIDAVNRKRKSWQPVPYHTIYALSQSPIHLENDLFIDYNHIDESPKNHNNLCIYPNTLLKFLQRQPWMKVLEKYRGKVIVAGGFLYKSCYLDLDHVISDDVDFFFINLTKEEMETIIIEIIDLLLDSIGYVNPAEGEVHHIVMQNQRVTTLQISDTPRLLIPQPDYKFQFIHRNYASPLEVIGGFDLPSLYFDGNNVYGNTFTAFCIAHRIIILDHTRLSPSYGQRVRKYAYRYKAKVVSASLIPISDITSYVEENNLFIRSDFSFDQYKGVYKNLRITRDIFLCISKKDYPVHGIITFGQDSDYEGERFGGHNLAKRNALIARHEKNDLILRFGKFDEVFRDRPLECEIIDMDEYDYQWPTKIIRWLGFSEYQRYQELVEKGDQNGVNQLLQDMRKQIEANIKIAEEKFRTVGIQWITENPGRQWTSSFNPINCKASDYFVKDFYRPIMIGLAEETVLNVKEGLKGILNKDMINLLLDEMRYCQCIEYERKYTKPSCARSLNFDYDGDGDAINLEVLQNIRGGDEINFRRDAA